MVGFRAPHMSVGVIHIIGVAGIGMSGLTEILHGMGCNVQGSDLSENDNTRRLQGKGVKVFKGHNAANIEGADYVVISSAVPEHNVERVAALKANIPVVSRAELLAELVAQKDTIAVSGAHGKTTTTSLIATMLENLGEKPTVINGGIINNRNTNAYLGEGDYLVVEADESDATFVKIPTKIVVVTNIDREHMSFYSGFDELLQCYRDFITGIPFYGFAVLCADHPEVMKIAETITNRELILYGIDNPAAHVCGKNIRFTADGAIFDVEINLPRSQDTLTVRDIKLATMGMHNVLNSISSIAIGARLGFSAEQLQASFKDFAGVKRRFTKIGVFNGATIIDDYAHHPVEVQVTLDTARRVADQNGGRVLAIFQPHRYSRVQDLFGDFQKCFDCADKIYISDIYPAGESPIDGISKYSMVNSAKKLNPTLDINELGSEAELPSIIQAYAKDGDIVIFMGAGSITYWAQDIAKKLLAE